MIRQIEKRIENDSRADEKWIVNVVARIFLPLEYYIYMFSKLHYRQLK